LHEGKTGGRFQGSALCRRLLAIRRPVAASGTYSLNESFHRTLKGRSIMNIILILVVGGVLGWLASMVMRTDAQQGIFLNVIVGIVGALLAGFIITPLIGGAPITSGSFDVMSLVASFIGAVVLLAIVNLFRRGRVR
jgi:uncharacterized membrane protein YeaQ/YmgE (transglycosylase-associated protein family)